MKLGALFSGGKDSTYSVYLAKRAGHKIACLITMVSAREDSYMFHFPNIGFAEIQAKTMEIPIVVGKTRGEKEKELNDFKKTIKSAIEKYKIKGIVCGAIRSNYQKQRVGKICDEMNLKLFSPLWHTDEEKYMTDLIKNFEIIITGISAEGLTKEFLGKKIDEKLLQRLKEISRKNKINLSGEGGEYETFVKKCPLFKRKIEIKKAEIKMDNEHSGKLEIKVMCLK